jgi:hypothetical protein
MQHKILIHISMLAGAILLVASAAATASPGCGSQVPSDDSQVSQYTETVPGACGNEETGGNVSSGGGGGSADGGSGDSGASSTAPVVPAEPATTDTSTGSAGSGQSSSGHGGDSSGQPNGQGGGKPADLESSTTGEPAHSNVTPLSDTATDSDDGGGLGWVIPAILGLTLLVAIAYVVRRRVKNGGGLSSPSGA